MERPELAIVVPAFNEAATIGQVVSNLRPHGTVIVVDDASADNTANCAAQSGADVVRHERNCGYDGALNSGFARADQLGLQYVITFDADGQHDVRFIGKYLDALRKSADVVLGVRPRRARLSEILFAWYTRVRFGIHDPLCGMKGYRMSVYRALGHFDSYGSIGTELLLFAARKRYRISEMPITISARPGIPRFGRVFSGNARILRALGKAFSSTSS